MKIVDLREACSRDPEGNAIQWLPPKYGNGLAGIRFQAGQLLSLIGCTTGDPSSNRVEEMSREALTDNIRQRGAAPCRDPFAHFLKNGHRDPLAFP
jgi:hypothetical protein